MGHRFRSALPARRSARLPAVGASAFVYVHRWHPSEESEVAIVTFDGAANVEKAERAHGTLQNKCANSRICFANTAAAAETTRWFRARPKVWGRAGRWFNRRLDTLGLCEFRSKKNASM